jgi:uncharacterized membrane protein
MTTSHTKLYKIIFLLLALFVFARYTQAPDFSTSVLGVGSMALTWVCFGLIIYVIIMLRSVIKTQKIIEEKVDLLVERSAHPLASVQHLSSRP